MQLLSAGKAGLDNGGKGGTRRGVSLPEALFTVDDARELLTVRSFGPERHRTNHKKHIAICTALQDIISSSIPRNLSKL